MEEYVLKTQGGLDDDDDSEKLSKRAAASSSGAASATPLSVGPAAASSSDFRKALADAMAKDNVDTAAIDAEFTSKLSSTVGK